MSQSHGSSHGSNHGNTPAAWSGVVIGLLGFVVGGVGLIFSPINLTLFYIGLGILVLAGVVYVVMDKMATSADH